VRTEGKLVREAVPVSAHSYSEEAEIGEFIDDDRACSSCGGGSPTCYSCGPCGRWWIRGEYLLWQTDGLRVPPLVTSSPDGTAQQVAGVLGADTTTILFGGSDLIDSSRSGGLITLGYKLPSGFEAIEFTYLGLGSESDGFQASSDGEPVLARPFFNVDTGQNDAELVAFSGLRDGSISTSVSSEFDAAEVLWRRTCYQSCGLTYDFVCGYRYAGLEEDLSVFDSTLETGGAAPGATRRSRDFFSTNSRFNGANLGIVATRDWRCWSLECVGKLGLGNTNSEVTINGSTTTTDAGGQSFTTSEGLLARLTNIGRFERDDFAVVPELGMTVSLALSYRTRATIGYRFIYWSQVARVGDQVDLDLNITDPLNGANRPRPLLDTTDFWAQGLNVGLEHRF
jgi:hypothetical protein